MADAPKPHLTRLLAVVPWEADGPGWRNDGLTAYFEDTYRDGSTRVREETMQGKDAPPRLQAMRKVGLLVRAELEPLFGGRQGYYRQVASPPLVSGEDAGEQEPSSVSASVDLTEGRR